jgi:hypothetical protein
MPNSLTSPRFFNPLMLWTDVAVKTGEMLVSSGSVIQARTQRMAAAGLAPSPADVAEFTLMGQEKLDAASQSGAAMAVQLHNTQAALTTHVVQNWFASVSALFAMVFSTTPAQALERHGAFVDAATRSAATVSQLSSASARIAQRALKPIHAKATSNARRLALPLAA